MKNLLRLTGFLAFVAIVSITFSTTSCKKDEPTMVKITVTDPDGAPVKDANVRLYGKSSQPDSVNPNAQVRYDERVKTDGAGQASFDLSYLTKPGQAGFMVLDITADKINQIGYGTIRVEEKKTNEKTVILQ